MGASFGDRLDDRGPLLIFEPADLVFQPLVTGHGHRNLVHVPPFLDVKRTKDCGRTGYRAAGMLFLSTPK
jgi:hypothetical protein